MKFLIELEVQLVEQKVIKLPIKSKKFSNKLLTHCLDTWLNFPSPPIAIMYLAFNDPYLHFLNKPFAAGLQRFPIHLMTSTVIKKTTLQLHNFAHAKPANETLLHIRSRQIFWISQLRCHRLCWDFFSKTTSERVDYPHVKWIITSPSFYLTYKSSTRYCGSFHNLWIFL